MSRHGNEKPKDSSRWHTHRAAGAQEGVEKESASSNREEYIGLAGLSMGEKAPLEAAESR